MYDNCKIISSDGTELSFCSRDRAEWYLRRNLAVVVQDDPLHVQLTFVPKQWEYDPYVLCKKENKCCVCGCQQNLTKHHVVPYAYRRLFPAYIKDHSCHDVLALCEQCHRAYELKANEFKQQLLIDYGIDIEYLRNKHKLHRKARGIAWRVVNNLPVSSTLSCMLYLGKSQLDKSDFYSILAIEEEKQDWYSGASLLIAKIDDIQDFVKRWRQHFVETMNPKFMPENWSVDYVRG